MEPLPSNVMYYVNQIAGYSKNTVKLQNINSDKAGPGAGARQTTVTMPTNTIINMESLAMHATFNGKGVDATSANRAVHCLCPRGGLAALAQRVSWAAGGIALDNGPTPYSVIYAVKNTTENTLDKMYTDQRVLNNPIISGYVNGADNGQHFDLICNEWLGFTQAAPCFLDTNLLPELRLTIQWESNNVLPIQYEGTNLGDSRTVAGQLPGLPPGDESGVSYSLDNIFWTVDVVSFSNGLLDAMNDRIIRESGALSVVYPQYQVFAVEANGAGGSVRGSASTMSLNRVYGMARFSEGTPSSGGSTISYAVNQAPILCVDNCGINFNNAFTNFTSEGVNEYQFKINNSPYPLYFEKPLGGYNSVVTSNARSYKHSCGSQVGGKDAWLKNHFSPMVSLNHPADQRFISGLDLRSINSQINWDVNPTSDPVAGYRRQQLLMTEQSSLLQIGGGRSLQVIS